MNKILFNGRMSDSFGIYISGSGTYNAPERDTESIEIPGRNGALVIDNKRFKNVVVSYPAFIRQMFKEHAAGAREWLLQSAEYVRLEDSYHPEYFRLARFQGPLDFDTRFLNLSGECTLNFDCKPQRFLKSGEYKITTEKAIILYNPTGMEALPYIRIYGTSGQLIVGNTIMDISEIDEYIDIDCDTQNAFKETKNCNDKVTNAFPTFPAGETGIIFSGDITRVEITPRWWTV